MGGDATFSGTTYQARVIAYVYLHVLAQMPLGWFSPADDAPYAVSGETNGPGDDALVEFGSDLPPAEIQAKHGLSGGDELIEIIAKLGSEGAEDSVKVVVTLDRLSSTRWLYTVLPADLARIRARRPTDVRTETKRLTESLNALGTPTSALLALYVVPIDIDSANEPEAKTSIRLLQEVILDDRDQAASAWGILVNDAADICARKLRRSRKDLIALLQGAGIKVRPPAKDDVWHRRLDFTKQTLGKQHFAAALALLTDIEKQLAGFKGARPEPLVYYRLAQQQGAALLGLERPREALDSARKALDFEPTGLHAFVTASSAARQLDDLSSASYYAKMAVEMQPHEPLAWGLLAQANLAQGLKPPDAPPGITESTHYRMSLAEAALWRGDKVALLSLTSSLLADGERSPALLFQRANALIDSSEVNRPPNDRFEEIERLTTEVIQTLADDAHPITIKAYLVRAAARRLQNNVTGSDEDLERARAIDPDDIDALCQHARIRAENGDDAGALVVLNHPAVERSAGALAMRARLEAGIGNAIAARTDIDSAVVLLDGSPDDDRLRLILADAALISEQPGKARSLLDAVDGLQQTTSEFSSLAGRLAFAEGDGVKGAQIYCDAATENPDDRPLLLAELASLQLAARHPDDAVKTFDSLKREEIPNGAHRLYTRALFMANDLYAAQNFIDYIATLGPLPDWTLAAAADIALKREDAEAAVAHLSKFVEAQHSNLAARIQLARMLIDLGERTRANTHIDYLRTIAGLPALERMQIAQLLHAAGRSEEALPIAHAAFREANSDPRFHRAFIMITFMGKGGVPAALSVESETYVKLSGPNGETLEYIVRSSESVDARISEIRAVDAATIGLLGLKPGDAWIRNRGTWQEKVWTVEEILPVMLRDAQEAAMSYEARFPAEPFFLAAFNVGTGDSVKDLAPIIGSLESRKKHVKTVFKVYREQGLPLGMIAGLLGSTIPEIMERLSEGFEGTNLVVEWADRGKYERARSLARSAERIVVARSALHTMSSLGMLELLARRYSLVTSRSAIQQLRTELEEAEKHVEEGHKFIARGEAGLIAREWEPGDPVLIARRDSLRDTIAFVREQTKSEARPFEAIQPGDSEPGTMREMVGAESFDAVQLAHSLNIPLFADDLGLRRLEVRASPPKSFSTVTLLEALVDGDVIAPSERDTYLIRLLQARYTQVLPTRSLLVAALRDSSRLGEPGVSRVFNTLGAAGIELMDAARITAQVIRAHHVTADIQLVGIQRIVGFALSAMAHSWSIQASVNAIARAAAEEFALYPRMSEAVRGALRVVATEALRETTRIKET